MNIKLLTYASLLANQARLVTLGELNPQTAANRATALRQFLRVNHLQGDDVVGLEMRMHFPVASENLSHCQREEGRSDRSISNTRSALAHWKNAVIAADTARALACQQLTPFNEALKTVTDGQSIKRLARQAGLPSSMIYGWLDGKIPRPSNAKFIRRLEVFFGLERESLVALAGITGSSRPREQVGIPPVLEYRKTLGLRTKNRYYLNPPIDSPLRSQWTALMRYKTSAVPTLEREAGGRWTLSPMKVVQVTKATWWGFIDDVEVPSAKTGWAKIASYLGWMALPVSEGGLEIPSEQLQTLAWLAVPGHIEAYLQWLRKRCGGKYTGSTFVFLGALAWMVRPGDGYLYQQAEFQKTLPASFQHENWYDLCKRQHVYCQRLRQALGQEREISRDPFAPIRPIIDLPEPMEAIVEMLHRMRVDRPVGDSVNEALWARDLVLIKLLVSNPLRRRNLAALTWAPNNINGRHPDDSGSLYQRVDGSWWINVPKRLLKNRRGTAIRDYDSPVQENVWTDLERYLRRHRDVLIRWPTELVFLKKTRDPYSTLTKKRQRPYKRPAPFEHLPFMEMSKHIQQLTRRYLWKSDGIGTHAFRHIVATAILKAPMGDIKTAALVLNDSETTVQKHYAGLRSGDGSVRMGELLSKSFKKM